MKTIVTGGSGFIGSAVVRKLLERGRTVRVLVLPGHEAPALRGLDVETAIGDVRDYDSLLKAFKGCSTLYHLAANPNLWAPDPSVFEEINHQGTRNVLRAAGSVGSLDKIVYTSSAMVLKRSPKGLSREYALLDDAVEAVGPYSRSKLLASRAVMEAAGKGLPVVIVAPTMPLGPGDFNITPPTRMLLNFLNGKTKALFNCRLNIVDVRDAAEGHVKAEEKGEFGKIYVLAGTNLTLSQLFGKIAQMTGIRFFNLGIPYFAALGFARLSEFISDHLTKKPPLASVAGVRAARKSLWFDKAETATELELAFRPLEISLFDAIRDLLERGLVSRPIRLRKPGAHS